MAVSEVYIERIKEYEEVKKAIEEHVKEEEAKKLLRKLARFCTKRLGGRASFYKFKEGSYELVCSWEDEKFASGEYSGKGGLLEIVLAGKGLRGGVLYLRLPEEWSINIPVTFHDEAKRFTFKMEEEVVDGKGYWKVSLTFGR